MVKLSSIEIKKFTDEEIDSIVYEGITDDNKKAKYGLVFGNSMLIKERVQKAVELYQSKRIEKIIFMGGTGGISNQNKDNISEASQMKALAENLGVKKEDILVEDQSSNTFENIDNALGMLQDEILSLKNIIIITSEFHLRRCFAAIKKKFPELGVSMVAAPDGFSDRNNWFLSDNSWNTGRSLATYEAGLLIKYAKEGKIADLDVELNNLEKTKVLK